MAIEKLQYLLDQMKLLTPNEKGKLFSLFLVQEKNDMKGQREELFGSVKTTKELSDNDIKSVFFNPNLDDLIK